MTRVARRAQGYAEKRDSETWTGIFVHGSD
jgi:hypothetical protein